MEMHIVTQMRTPNVNQISFLIQTNKLQLVSVVIFVQLFLITHSLNRYEPYIYSSVTPLHSNEAVPHCILFSTPLHSCGHKFSDIYQIVSLPFQLSANFIYLPTYFVNYLFSFINIVKI